MSTEARQPRRLRIRVFRRASETGAATAAELNRIAARLRVTRRTEAQAKAARAGIWIVLPIGLCFLPAFLAVGVVPLAWGLLRSAT